MSLTKILLPIAIVLAIILTLRLTGVIDFAKPQPSPIETPAIETPSASPLTGKIAFVSDRDGNWEIYVMNADGTDQRRLTNNPVYDSQPAWSPDGKKLAFTSDPGMIYIMNADGSNLNKLVDGQQPAWSPDGKKIAFIPEQGNIISMSNICVINVDGTDRRMLTDDTGINTRPVWSPDGSKIVFSSYCNYELGSYRCKSHGIYTMNVDGSNREQLAECLGAPAWSPDGSKIAFISYENGCLYVINADGTGQIMLANDAWYNCCPAWSPDGSKIAFSSDHGGNHEIYVMNADGSNRKKLVDGWQLAWSPRLAEQAVEEYTNGGGKIAFVSGRDGNDEIYIMNADGTDQSRLTNNLASDLEPSWSPDGSKITFCSGRDGNSEIYVMNADGTDQMRLTNNPASDFEPAWSPDGSKIAYMCGGNRRVMNYNGTDNRRLDNDLLAGSACLAWSPDGHEIVFWSSHVKKGGYWYQDPAFYVVNADGSNLKRLAGGSWNVGELAWSPDGSKIEYICGGEVCVMNSDGTNHTVLTNKLADDSYPCWSPDSKKITFQYYRGGGNHEIYVINADGSNQKKLADGRSPAWSPR
jgi:Tol biopolymer transport system component